MKVRELLNVDMEEFQKRGDIKMVVGRRSLFARLVAVGGIVTSRRPELPLPTYVTIKAGTFPVRESNLFGAAKPAVDSVRITGDFEIGETKVTVAQFAAFVKTTNYEITGPDAEWFTTRLIDPKKQNHPVNCVNRDQDAKAYCEWLDEVEPDYNHFLPTAAQWELATRGKEGRLYPWGNEWIPDNVVSDHNSRRDTKPVDFTEGATLEGMRDLGNLSEWTATRYGDYDTTKTTDPRGPKTGVYAEVRGGSFNFRYTSSFRSARRRRLDPSVRYSDVGFRVARTKSIRIQRSTVSNDT